MHSQIDIDHCDTDSEERVGKAIAVLGVVVTVLAIITVLAGLFLE